MKNLFKVLSLAAFVAIVFASCEKETSLVTTSNNEVISGEASYVSSGLDLFRYENTSNITKKGYLNDYSFLVMYKFIELGIATDLNNQQYQTLKVGRSDGTFFYMMIENLAYTDGQAGVWAYKDNSANVSKYGRLYQWEKAVELGENIYMDIVTASGSSPVRVYGKLPGRSHVNCLSDKLNLPSLPDQTGIEGMAQNMNTVYFDLFAFGVTKKSWEGGFYSLGGRRENLEFAPNNIPYTSLNELGQFWTRDASSGTGEFHYPLTVLYKNNSGEVYNYSAFINVEHHNHFGYSVRYVFDPFE